MHTTHPPHANSIHLPPRWTTCGRSHSTASYSCSASRRTGSSCPAAPAWAAGCRTAPSPAWSWQWVPSQGTPLVCPVAQPARELSVASLQPGRSLHWIQQRLQQQQPRLQAAGFGGAPGLGCQWASAPGCRGASGQRVDGASGVRARPLLIGTAMQRAGHRLCSARPQDWQVGRCSRGPCWRLGHGSHPCCPQRRLPHPRCPRHGTHSRGCW
jgi:hypothetical protein